MAHLSFPRDMHSATLLADGRVLVAGGWTGSQTLASVEIYDPASNDWSQTGALVEARHGHSSTLLADGRVLIVGGYRGTWLASAEIYDPISGTSVQTNPLFCHGTLHQTTVLLDGRVLVVGGACGSGRPGIVAHAEIFDPLTGTWQATTPMVQARNGMSATLLPDGRVWIIAGGDGEQLVSTEIYDPSTETWSISSPLNMARVRHTATILPDEQLIITGGRLGTVTLTSSELFQ